MSLKLLLSLAAIITIGWAAMTVGFFFSFLFINYVVLPTPQVGGVLDTLLSAGLFSTTLWVLAIYYSGFYKVLRRLGVTFPSDDLLSS